jgi:GNAT superfamily N-acetyltransferase
MADEREGLAERAREPDSSSHRARPSDHTRLHRHRRAHLFSREFNSADPGRVERCRNFPKAWSDANDLVFHLAFCASFALPGRAPCLLLARLAVSMNTRGQGFGSLLLADAIERTRRSIAEVGGIGLYVDALDEEASSFYQHFGFEPFLDDGRRLFLNVAW